MEISFHQLAFLFVHVFGWFLLFRKSKNGKSWKTFGANHLTTILGNWAENASVLNLFFC